MTVAEKISTACNASNLKLSSESSGSADVLIAMGWSKHQLGIDLLRLSSEYDSVAKPKPISHENMVKLALTFKKADKTLSQKDCETLARQEAAKWQTNEKALFLPRLKTLPAVVQKLTAVATKWQIQEPKQRATVCVGYWLDQICHHCHGLKFEIIPDSPTLSAVQCQPCQGVGVKSAPYGQIGRRLVGYLEESANSAQSAFRR